MTDLFTYADTRPVNYRPTDPKTSRDAGRAAHDFSAGHHQAILNILRRAGRAMAPEEIADALDWAYARGKSSVVLDKVQICKRCAELLTGDAIERTAEQHTNRSGRKAFRIRLKQPQSVPAGDSTPERHG